MNDLTKQQMILVALLVSFVTSLATGIVTVSLLDQAPDGTTRTVSQVIEKTIQQIVPADSSASASDAVVATHDAASAALAVQNSVVRFTSGDGKTAGGLGLIVNKAGVIVTDKSAIAQLSNYSATLPDGSTIPVAVIQSQENGDIVFLEAFGPQSIGHTFTPVQYASSATLGESVLTLSGTTTYTLTQGIIDETPGTSTHDISISTNISPSKSTPGSPLFTMDGGVLGIRTSSLKDGDGALFYSMSTIRAVVPGIK